MFSFCGTERDFPAIEALCSVPCGLHLPGLTRPQTCEDSHCVPLLTPSNPSAISLPSKLHGPVSSTQISSSRKCGLLQPWSTVTMTSVIFLTFLMAKNPGSSCHPLILRGLDSKMPNRRPGLPGHVQVIRVRRKLVLGGNFLEHSAGNTKL